MADLERYSRNYQQEYGDPGYQKEKRSVSVEEPLFQRVWRVINHHPRFKESRSLHWKGPIFTFNHAVREALATWVHDHEESPDWEPHGIDYDTYNAALENKIIWRKYLQGLNIDKVPHDQLELTLGKLRTIATHAVDTDDRARAQRLIHQIEGAT